VSAPMSGREVATARCYFIRERMMTVEARSDGVESGSKHERSAFNPPQPTKTFAKTQLSGQKYTITETRALEFMRGARPVVRNSESDESRPGAVMPARSPFAGGFIQVFLVFSQIGLSSFGGSVAAWMHREFVERRGWLEESEFAAAFAFARILPGVNIVNLAVLIGRRLKGLTGAAAAVAGLLTGPVLVVIGLGFLYEQFAGIVFLQNVLEGIAASTVGLLISMGIASGRRIIREGITRRDRKIESAGAIAVLAATFVLIALLRFPTVLTVLFVAPISIALALFSFRASPVGEHHDRRR
jgi:chromate transporter